jgi:hypothetical protein
VRIEIFQERAMRLPRFRFTMRKMMVVVAAVAVVETLWIETARMSRRRLDYQLRSIGHGIAAARYDGRGVVSCRGPLEPPSAVRNPSRAAYHAAMSRKWADAAEHPWLPVEPDPPEPQ